MHKFQTVDEYLSSLPQPLCDVGHAVASVIAADLPGAEASLWHGHPTWKLGKAPVCLLKAYTRHLTFGLWRGAAVSDHSGRLVPGGAETMASVKLRGLDDVDAELFAGWLRQVAVLER